MLNHVVDTLMPPASLVVVAFLVVLVGRSWARRASAALLLLAVVLAMPLVSTLLLDSLAPGPTPEGTAPKAVVILSADGIRVDGVQDLEPGPLTLDRMRAGAALARRTGLPILVSGGAVDGVRTTLAQMMADSLQNDFRIPVAWQEGASVDTWQNALFSANILRPAGITRIYLVTQFWHMRRSLIAFRRAGLDPVPFPVRPPFTGPFSWRDLVPRPSSWYYSSIALHEWIGLIYYRMRS